MPVFESNGKKWNVPEERIDAFMKENPDAFTVAEKDGKRYRVDVGDYKRFKASFGDEAQTQDPFDANVERMKRGEPTQRITTQSMIDTHPELGLGGGGGQSFSVNDSEIERLQGIKDTAQKQIDEAGFFDRFFDADTRAAVAARNQAEEALEMYDEAKHADEGWFDRNVMGVVRGIVDKAGDLATWDFGASGVASGYALKDVTDKLERGEKLSASEQNMLDAFGLASAVQAAYQDKVGMAYKVGQSLPESAAFMGSLVLNPAAGAGRKIAQSAAKAAVKKYGASMVSKLAKGAARVGGDALEMAVATAVPGAGRVAEDYYNRVNGQSTFDIDENGIIRYGGQVEQEAADDAIWKAFGSQFIENYSESVGNYFAPMGQMLSNLTSKGLKSAHLGKLADVVNDISSSQFSRGLKRFKDATKFDGFVGEYLEEVAGNFMNAATVGDMNFNSAEDPNSVFNVEMNVQTALSCALMSGTMYAVEAPVSVYNRRIAKRNLDNADKEAEKYWGSAWGDMRSMMDEADGEDMMKLVMEAVNAPNLNKEQKESALKYAERLMQYQGYNARKMQNQMESTDEANAINKAYDEGSELQTPYDKHSAKRVADKAEEALAQDAELAKMVVEGGNNPVATVNAMAESGKYTEAQIKLAKDYYTAVNRMNGLTAELIDRVDSQIESANAEVDANTNKDNGSVTKVLLRDGREGYVVEGSVARTEKGLVDVNGSDETVMVRLQNGEVKMMNPNKDLFGVAWIDSPEKLKADNHAVLREKLIDQGIGEIDWNPATPNPKVGDSFEIGGVPVTIVSHDGKGGMFVVPTEEYQSAVGSEQKMQQLIAKAQQSQPIPASEYKNWASAQLDAQEDAQAMAQQEAASGESVGEQVNDGVNAPVNTEAQKAVEEKRPMTEDEAAEFIFQMERNAVEAPEIELTPENWIAEFGEDGLVETPIGQVKFGQGQYLKLQQQGRNGKLGMIRPTLANPDIIIEVVSKAKEGDTAERGTSYVFIKSFKGKDGKRMYYFTSITVNKDGNEVVVSNQEKKRNRIMRLLQEGNVIWRTPNNATTSSAERQGLYYEQSNEAETTAKGSVVTPQTTSSTNKDSDKNVQSQENKEKPLHERKKEDVFRELGEMYGEKMPHKVEVTAKAWDDKVKKAQKKVDEAQRKLDDAPIGEDAKQKTDVEKAKAELKSVKVVADFWAEMDAEIKQGERMAEEASAEEIAAVLSEEADNYEQSISETENGQESTTEASEGSDTVLPEESSDNTGGTETDNESASAGNGIGEEGEGAYDGEQDSEVEDSQKRILDVFGEAARIAAKNRREQIKARVKMWEAAGVKVKVHERTSGIHNMDARRAIMSGEIVAGWYDGEVHIYLPHISSLAELDKTILHEAISHKGLRELMGKENFDKLCDKVWEMMPESAQKRLLAYEGVKNIEDEVKQKRAAADEYMAHLAEDENLSPEEKSLWQKIVQWFKDLFTTKVDEKEQAVSILNQSRLTNKDISELLKLSYANLKKNAVERIEKNVGEVDTEKGDVRFAVRDVLKGESRAQAIKDLMAVTGRSKRTVAKWLKAEESLASVILNEDNVGILDMEADESVPSIWKNSDYPQGTVEFSNICKKRLPLTTIYQRLQKEFPDTLFDAQTLNTIRNTMKEMGEDVACALCFVEDRRQLLGEIGQGFIDAVKGMDVELNDNQKVALDKLRESGDKYVPNLFDIITLDGMKELRKKHPAVAQAFIEYNNARGMQSGRLFQAYSAYNREILKYNKKKVDSINNNGGLRIFSFSDFEAHHLIDLVQVLTDCAAKGIKVQGYTKVPEFAKAVKDTNAKINRSLIPKGVGYVDADYVPKEGEAVSPNVINGKRLLFDTIEGIDVNNPNFFDSTGSKSVGNILVAINDEHARLAMADSFVDYIIGFHTGQSKAILKGKGIDTWVNYKNEQLDKEIVTDENGNQKMKNAPHHGLNIYTDVLNAAEAEGKPINTAKQFTERFIEECDKRGWIPRFHRFLNRAKDGRFLYTPGYHKFLIDFKLFDKNGKILPQEAVVPKFDNAFNKQILDEYVKGVKEEMPNNAVYEAVKEAVGLGEGTRFRIEFTQEEQSIIDKAKSDGTFMKAPNGNPTNLTEKQWAQVRTKAFKKWFGDWELPFKTVNIVTSTSNIVFNLAQKESQAKKEIIKWATENNIIRTLTNKETNGKGVIHITPKSIGKIVDDVYKLKDEKLQQQNLNLLLKLEDLIRESELGESHVGYIKGQDDVRRPSNGFEQGITVFRYFGAVEIDGKTYRAKTTVKRTDYKDYQKIYTYEITKIELLDGITTGEKSNSPTSNNSISFANLLNGVENDNKNGEKLLNFSKVVDENGEPLVMIHNSTASGITEFRPNVGNAIFFADKIAQNYVSGFERGENDYEVFLNIKNPYTESYEAAFIDETDGVDGVFVTAEVDEGIGHAAIVKHPNQIKSATDNVGTFDEGNNDIRFRISTYGKTIKEEVDRVTSKYNSKDVMFFDKEMTDEEVSAVVPGYTAADIKPYFDNGILGGYSSSMDKISIFANNNPVYDVEDTIFHENLHALLAKKRGIIDAFAENALSRFPKNVKKLKEAGYPDEEIPEELLVRLATKAMAYGIFDDVAYNLPEREFDELKELLNEFGYGYEQEIKSRALAEGRRGTPTLLGGEEIHETRGIRQDAEGVEGKKAKGRARKEELGKLFDQVADMGLEGVLGNKEYSSMMVDIFKALPEKVRTKISDDAIRLYGGSIAPAVSDYIGPKSKDSLMDKVVTIVREALRKIGIDLDLHANEVRYMAWRSKKPLDRRHVLEVAEDMDMRHRLKVGEYAGSPSPDGGGTRFRVSGKLKVRDEYESTVRKGGYQAREAVQDAMLSLRRFQELIEKASGKAVRGFENAWWHENRMSSMVQAAIHEMERKVYKPMMDAVKKLMNAAKLSENEVADYLMLKHGIERNREMAVRKALTDSDGKIDRTRLEQWYQDKRNVRSRTATPHLDTWRKQQEELDNIALMYGADMSRDYSGLTSMFGTDDLADSTQKAYDEVEALETAHPAETEALGKAVKAMTQNTLDYAYESGLMDKKVYDELSHDMYDYYIPLRGFDETTSDEVYAYLDQDRGAFNAPLKRAKGRSSKADNPLAYMKSIAESGIMQGNRNKMKQSFLALVMNRPSDLISVKEGVWAVLNPATGEWEAASVPPIPDNATPADVEAIMTTWDEQMELRAQSDPDNVRKITEADDVPYRVIGNRMNQHQVLVRWNGKSYTLTVNGNPRLAMALNGLTNPNNTSNDGKVAADVQKAVNNFNRQLASWYTTRNPDFVASNFMRDTFYTNTIVRAKEGNRYANQFHKHYAKLLMPGRMLKLFRKWENGTLDTSNPMERDFYEFMMNGGETGYSNLKDMEEIKKQISKELKGGRWKDVEKFIEKFDLVNRAVENTARFAAYRTSKQMGRATARAIFDAKEISVNFNKKGAGGTFYKGVGQTRLGNMAAMVGAGGRALYVFFNAAIQGTTNIMHVMKKNKKGTGAGLAAMFLMGAVVPMLFGDDDEKDYYDLPEHVRRNHLILPGLGDAWVSIPLPIEYRIMYGAGELLTSWRTGHEKGENIGMKMLNLTGQALPLNFLEEGMDAFIPSALSPLWQVYNNKSWTGLPIYKDNEFNKDDPEYTKAYKNVNRAVYNFTKALYDWTFDEESQKEGINLNPAVIEHLAKGYFGGLVTTLDNVWKTGEMIAGSRDFDWRNVPVANRTVKTGDERTKEKKVQNEYFENLERLDFLQSRKRLINKTMNGAAVPEEDKAEARKDFDALINSNSYKEYMKFNEKKKQIDKLRKAMKEQGASDELEKRLNAMMESANNVISE